VFAEWTVAQFHVGKVVLVLNEELAAIFAHIDSHVCNKIFEVAARVLGIEV
jgi:hypothetical protein